MLSAHSHASYRPFRLEIQGRLRLLEPLHIGTGERWSLATDAPILLSEACEMPYIPGTSLRGALRDHIEREAALLGCNDATVLSLFGATPKIESNKSCSGRLTVLDSYSVDKIPIEIRDHVRLEHKSGAAANGAKFDGEVALPHEGGSFSFRLIYEGDGEKDEELILVGEALRLLKSGDFRIGAKSGWGYGRVDLTGVTFKASQRSQSLDLAAYLGSRLGREPQVTNSFSFPQPKAQINIVSNAFSQLAFQIRVHFEGPVLVKAPIPPTLQCAGDKSKPETYAKQGLCEADHVFLSRLSDKSYYFPGSSLRGVLRSQAHRIDSTLETALFGCSKQNEGKGTKGLIEIGDGSLVNEPIPVFLDHVAIDRITAAAVDGKKFAQSALASPKFDLPIKLRFTSGTSDLGAVRLAAFLLRDLMDGRLWAGSGVSRGYGYIRFAELLSLQGELLHSSAWNPPLTVCASRPGRMLFEQNGPFRFDDPALRWLWSSIDSFGRVHS